MGIVTGILVYVMMWWVVFFMVLPWGVQPIANPEVGHQRGAPFKPKLWMKALVTTCVASVGFLILYLYVPADMMQWAIFREH
jgi:predicted secreted protein